MPTPNRRRLSAEQTRSLLLDAALDDIDRAGLPAELRHISLEDTIRAIELPRSSGYNAWQKVSQPDETAQDAFQRELLHLLVSGTGMGVRDNAPLEAAVAAVIAERKNLTPLEFRRELVRRATEVQFASARDRRGFRVALAVVAAANSVPEGSVDTELMGWLRAAEAGWLSFMVDSYKTMARLLELNPHPELDGPLFYEQFTTAVLAAGEGMFPRLRTSNPAYILEIDGPGPGGTRVPWTLYALCIDALIERFFVTAPPRADPVQA